MAWGRATKERWAASRQENTFGGDGNIPNLICAGNSLVYIFVKIKIHVHFKWMHLFENYK